jgi:hypothetical protein
MDGVEAPLDDRRIANVVAVEETGHGLGTGALGCL